MIAVGVLLLQVLLAFLFAQNFVGMLLLWPNLLLAELALVLVEALLVLVLALVLELEQFELLLGLELALVLVLEQ